MGVNDVARLATPRSRVHCPVVELRQYTLYAGARETLIALFEREFIESQEAVGIEVIAQFRDLDRPDLFTWLRGFPSMEARAAALGAFYDGPVWARHKDAANATMIDSDNVRLLRPRSPGTGFVLGDRPALGAKTDTKGVLVATLYPLVPSRTREFFELLDLRIQPRLAACGSSALAWFETEPSPNTFPRLPVRENEPTVVGFAWFESLTAHGRHLAALAGDRVWADEIRPAIAAVLAGPPEHLRLSPTARSRAIGPEP